MIFTSMYKLRIARILIALMLFGVATIVRAETWTGPRLPPLQSAFNQPLFEGTADQSTNGIVKALGLISTAKIFVPYGATQPGTADLDFRDRVSVWAGGVVRADDLCQWNGTSCTRTLSASVVPSVRRLFAGRINTLPVPDVGTNDVACYPFGGSCARVSDPHYNFLGTVVSAAAPVTVSGLSVYSDPIAGSCNYSVSYVPDGCRGISQVKTNMRCSIAKGAKKCTAVSQPVEVPAGSCIRITVIPSSSGNCTASTAWSFRVN